MALFESYDRREPQILAVLKNYGIGSVEECAEICKAKGLDIYKLVEGIQPICFENGRKCQSALLRLFLILISISHVTAKKSPHIQTTTCI